MYGNTPQVVDYFITVNTIGDNYADAIVKDQIKSPKVTLNKNSFAVRKGIWKLLPSGYWELTNAVTVTDYKLDIGADDQTFSLDLGQVNADEGYEITYKGDIGYLPENGEVFQNEATLYDGAQKIDQVSAQQMYVAGSGTVNGYTYSLKIHKTNEDNQPLADAKFDVIRKDTDATVGTVTTGKDGNATIPDLLKADYLVKEVKAPTGYTLSKTPVTVAKTDFSDSSREASVTIKNVKSESTPTTPIDPGTTPSNPTTPIPVTPAPSDNDGQTVVEKGTVVYSLKKIYLYKNSTFSKLERKTGYTQKPRAYRPMFVVMGYARSSNGRLRYQVRDVNYLTKNRHLRGYITTQWAYVRPVYYQTANKTVTVINPNGVYEYHNERLAGGRKHLKQGTVLHVKKIVNYHLPTRFVLSNGNYVTANRKLVQFGKVNFPKAVKAKHTINRYHDVDLTHRNKKISKGTILRVYSVDYSHQNSTTQRGTMRYRVKGGFITANKRLVQTVAN
ncbi:DUF5776 domain-containing protein [uncultured Secundilactobacillus sp.]|uniref:DUF5776 domain-containing protein n=1 Tax=uncultured Secundilactobacillus sp. TaxID=2813935 RepID=UPI00258975B3|nr:DUF5776 domain-containing protein [uncultured Secundilactobacillus sp.]